MRYYRAVTLIEMMIVIAIIGIITSVTIVSFQSGKADSRLKAAQREAASTIKLAQSYALQGKTQGGKVPCGYGFRFIGTGSYEIFYNPPALASDCDTENGNSSERQWIDNTETPPAESFELNNEVTVTSDLSNTEIFFTVPHANAFDKSGTAYSSSQDIIFDFAGTTTKKVTINKGGFVNESD